jgi:chemotaxis signal transduction protein
MEAGCLRGIVPASGLVGVGDLSPSLIRYFGQWTCGFASLAGRDFPVIDLRSKLGLAHGTHGRQPYIVVVEITTGDGPRLAGFVADRVCEVIRARDRDFHLGKLRLAGRPRQVLDPDTLLDI